MNIQGLLFLALLVYISIIQVHTADQDSDENKDEYDPIKRLLLRLKSTSTPSPSDICASNPCEHDGICISNGQTTYECKCTNDYYGKNCEMSFRLRSITKRRSYFKLLDHIKRILERKGDSEEDKNDGKAYYDYINGIYY